MGNGDETDDNDYANDTKTVSYTRKEMLRRWTQKVRKIYEETNRETAD